MFVLSLFSMLTLFLRIFRYKFFWIFVLCTIHFSYSSTLSYSYSIFAIVNGAPISTYDVEQRARLLSLGKQIELKTMFAIAANELIAETLKISEATKRNISVSAQELSNAFSQVAQNNNISVGLLKRSLALAELPVSILEKKLLAELIWNKFIILKFAHDIEESRDKLSSSFPVSKKEKIIFYNFRQIIFMVTKSLSDKKRSDIIARANSLSEQSVLCTELDKHIGKDFAVRIEPSILLPKSGLSNSVYNLLKNLRPGKFSSPKRIEEGYSMLLYCGDEIKEIIPRDIRSHYLFSNLDRNVRKLASSYYLSLRKKAVIEFRNKT